jgi:hypothetical protein
LAGVSAECLSERSLVVDRQQLANLMDGRRLKELLEEYRTATQLLAGSADGSQIGRLAFRNR